MNKENILDSIKKLREVSSKRNFNQSIDLVINLINIDLKKPEQKVDTFITIPFSKGKPIKICALVGNELAVQSKTVFDKTILNEEFQNYNDKKILKKLASEYDFFIAQSNLMAQIATVFGKTLGPRGKMPNPKAGCVVPGTAQLEPLKNKLQKTIHLQTKNDVSLKASIGSEIMKDEEIVENIYHTYNSLVHTLPQEQQNIKSIVIKTTMGPPIFITDKGPVIKIRKEKTEKTGKKEKKPKK